MVSELIDFDIMQWKVPMIEALFNERDVCCTLATPLSSTLLKDDLTWAFTKEACYSVKTAYMLGKGGILISSIKLCRHLKYGGKS